jgi:hypothetical protein
VAVRTPIAQEKKSPSEQYQLFEDKQYAYRVFVTAWKTSVASVVEGYAGRAAAENLIKEANNDAGIASVPGRNFIVNKPRSLHRHNASTGRRKRSGPPPIG